MDDFMPTLLLSVSYEQLTQIPETFDVVEKNGFGCSKVNAGVQILSVS